jgi:hypothetical protein
VASISEIFSLGVGAMTHFPMRALDHRACDVRAMAKGQTNYKRAIICHTFNLNLTGMSSLGCGKLLEDRSSLEVL